MHITKVKLQHIPAVKEGTMQDGLPVAPHPDIYNFEITTDENSVDGATVVVPADPTNRHYNEVAEWYKKKKIKPFRFKFE